MRVAVSHYDVMHGDSERAVSAPEPSRPSVPLEPSAIIKEEGIVPSVSTSRNQNMISLAAKQPSPASALSGKLQMAMLGTATPEEQVERTKIVSKLKAPSFGVSGKGRTAGAKVLGARKLKRSETSDLLDMSES